MKLINHKSSLTGRRQNAARGLRSGFTLLEVMLALGLAVIVVGLVVNAVNGTLRFIDRGREKTERDQLARAVLTKVGNDVRGVVRYEPFDSKGMMSVKATSNTGSTGNKNTGNKNTGNKNTNKTADSGDQSSTSSTASSSASSSTTTTTIAGVYGDQYRLQIDVGRLPSVYEYGSQSSDSSSTSATVPTDVKTVSYYVNGSSSAPTGAAIDGVGLVRTELDRSAALYTSTSGSTPEAEGAGVIIAPEVSVIEFQYFDGTSWLTSWDSTASSGLPQSIKISVALTTPSNTGEAPATPASYADAAAQDPDSAYTLVVLLPARDATTVPASSTDSSSSSSGSNSNTSNTQTTPK